jgi:hypothetical protein
MGYDVTPKLFIADGGNAGIRHGVIMGSETGGLTGNTALDVQRMIFWLRTASATIAQLHESPFKE